MDNSSTLQKSNTNASLHEYPFTQPTSSCTFHRHDVHHAGNAGNVGNMGNAGNMGNIGNVKNMGDMGRNGEAPHQGASNAARGNAQLIATMESIVGRRYVLTDKPATERFRRGFRYGYGDAIAVVRPGTLLEQWRVLKACVAADKIVIFQASNTSLTGGATPTEGYDREVVIINTMRLNKLTLINNGKQVISFPGGTLFELEDLLLPLQRQPHSLIGSSCIGASIVGGVCNNSGGSLIERGPSYTELSLYAQIEHDGSIALVNHLGINLGDDPETILTRLQKGDFKDSDILDTNKRASDTEYQDRVRDVHSSIPARFNADRRRLYEAAGCAGKLAVFAVRLDTYPVNTQERVFYIGTNNPDELADLRRHILTSFKNLPVSGEYLHRHMFDVAKVYGKDTVVMIDKLGTSRLPKFFALKGTIDARLNKIKGLKGFTDRFMQALSRLWPQILPPRMLAFHDRFEHHLILKMRDNGIDEAEQWLPSFFKERSGFGERSGDYFVCTPREAKIAGLHRFASAGAAIRYQVVHEQSVGGLLALDIALPRNTREWFETLPPSIESKLLYKLYSGHFFCHVLHQDYIVKKGVDIDALKKEMLALLDARGVEYPAEHNVGHMYHAKSDLASFYRECDPTNTLNPGIGKTSKHKHYA